MAKQKLDEWAHDIVIAIAWTVGIIVALAVIGACWAIMSGRVIIIH